MAKAQSPREAAIYEEDDLVVIVTSRESVGPPLTPAERSVAGLVARGLTNIEIARARNTGIRTVANQVASALAKLGLTSRVALSAWWSRGGHDGSRS